MHVVAIGGETIAFQQLQSRRVLRVHSDQKECHNDRDEEKRWDVLACAERVHSSRSCEAHDAASKGARAGAQCVDQQLLQIPQLGKVVPVVLGPALCVTLGHVGLGRQGLYFLLAGWKHIPQHDGVKIIPLLRRGSSCRSFSPIFVNSLGLNNVKELFRIHIATGFSLWSE